MSDALVGVLIFAAAVLYSAAGHAGGSGYLAALAFGGVPPGAMKPTALALNVLVASVATWRFARAGCLPWGLLRPFALGSVPCAFLGGRMAVPSAVYRPLVAGVLLFASYRLLRPSRSGSTSGDGTHPPRPAVALVSGGIIGGLSGMTGHGGGIFLGPLLVLMGWADAKGAAGASAGFILANSVAGLAGQASGLSALPAAFPAWALAALVGGSLGSEYGSRYLSGEALRRLLAVVLALAGLKLIAAT